MERKRGKAVELRSTVVVLPPRRRAKGSDRRKQILEATLDVLAQKSFAEITVGDVARSIGISTALVLSHFGTKEALLLETQRMVAREHHDNWEQALAASGPSAAEKLWVLADAEFALGICTPKKIMAWKAFWAEGRLRREYIVEFGPRNVEYLRLLTELCATLIKQGRYTGYDARVCARSIDALGTGLWMELTSTATPMTLNETRKTALTHLAMMFPRHFTPKRPIKQK